MKQLRICIPPALGEIINIKHQLDSIRHLYDSIKINFATGLYDETLHTSHPNWGERKRTWDKFLTDIGQLFFSDPPYEIANGAFQFLDMQHTGWHLGITPTKAEMPELLCFGTPLVLSEPYIVLTTKVRNLHKSALDPLLPEFFNVIKNGKYKVVLLGERDVRMRKEYEVLGDQVFGIYKQIIEQLPSERLLDLTTPALGEQCNDLSQIRQDCLIMREAKAVITFGIGGNLCLSSATAKMSLGYRNDSTEFFDIAYSNEYPNAIITKDWFRFISKVKEFI